MASSNEGPERFPRLYRGSKPAHMIRVGKAEYILLSQIREALEQRLAGHLRTNNIDFPARLSMNDTVRFLGEFYKSHLKVADKPEGEEGK